MTDDIYTATTYSPVFISSSFLFTLYNFIYLFLFLYHCLLLYILCAYMLDSASNTTCISSSNI